LPTKLVKSQQHCVDLAPSAYSVLGKRRVAGSSRRQPRDGYYRSPDLHSGAIPRASQAITHQSNHFGKLAAAAMVVAAGVVVWSTGASETIAPKPSTEPEPLKTVATTPAFFFDDEVDALERSQPQERITDSSQSIAIYRDPAKSSQHDILANADVPTAHLQDTRLDDGTDTLVSAMAMPITTAAAPLSQTAGIDLPAEDAPVKDARDASNAELVADPNVKKVSVALGDTLSGILNEHGLKVDQMSQLLTNPVVKEHLSNIDVGQVFELTHDDSGNFQDMTTRVGNNRRVSIARTGSEFYVNTVEIPIERRRLATSGRINQSLFLAAEQANIKQSTIMEMANIFQWELDFARDIRDGDSFSLIYDRLYREGEYIGDGDILAAEFVRGGKSYKAIRFTTDDGTSGYYSPEGESKLRTFMRHPVDVVRITSKFNPGRLHPVLHKIRAHRGVDYGSPHGSPIYATADGRVIHSGNKSAYGKTVILKHGEKYSTLYAHMSRISDKSQVGKRVKLGDVIGYVGNTGRVTGTHLHYEFRVDGKQIDPLKLELPAAAPLDSKYLSSLTALSNEMSELLTQALKDIDKQVATGPKVDLTESEDQP